MRKRKRGPKTQAEVDAMNCANPLDIEEMKRDLRGGGWTEIRHDTWMDLAGRYFRGPYKAWTIWAGVELRPVMIDAAEREKLATRIYRECVTRAYPEQEVTFNHTRCVELLALCANEALEKAAVAASTCDIRAIGEGAIRIRIAEKIRKLKAEG